MKFRPVHDRIILREVAETTSGGIELPFTKSAHRHGLVLAVGDGTRFSSGQLLPVRCREGDRILFEGGVTIRLDGEDVLMIREAEIVGIFDREKKWGVSSAPYKQSVEADAA